MTRFNRAIEEFSERPYVRIPGLIILPPVIVWMLYSAFTTPTDWEPSPYTVALAGIGVALLAAYRLYEYRTSRHP